MREAREGSPTPHCRISNIQYSIFDIRYSIFEEWGVGSGEWPYTPRLGFTTLLKIEPNV